MAKIKGNILVVDDNAGIRAALEILLPFTSVRLLASPNGIMSEIDAFRPDVVLLDMNFNTDINTGNEGLFWLQEIKNRDSTIEVVLFTAYADISLAVEGMKRGAYDFVVKPWENAKLISILHGALDRRKSVVSSVAHNGTGVAKRDGGGARMLWGSGSAMAALHRTVEKIAPTDATVLITGENGTGKDLLAGEIHRLSGRCSFNMVCVDVGAIPETLFESELFGHVKGAFTDAHADHKGFFEQADKGTLFLDEIGNIPLHLQAKLLRVLQNRTINRVGESRPVPIDIRLVCATNKNLEQMVKEGLFREDLYYRINTIHLALPSLKERRDEILPLCRHFIKIFSQKYRRNVSDLATDAVSLLEKYRWSGNIRELQNCIEKAVILSEGEILSLDEIKVQTASMEMASVSEQTQSNIQTLEEMEIDAVRSAMEKYGGNLSLVAKALNISRPTLYSKLKKYNI